MLDKYNHMRVSKKEQKKAAKEHLLILFDQAEKSFGEDPKIANRHIRVALNIRSKFKLSLTKDQKSHFCKECNSFLMPGKNCIVRTKNKMMLYHCKECGNIRRFGIKNKNKN